MKQAQTLYGWGRWPKRSCRTSPVKPGQLGTEGVGDKGVIARGLGRSYGDVAINPQHTLMGAHRTRILSFDQNTGALVAQGGLSMAELLEVFVPRGWFPPVTPGTKFVTLAGLIAADAHGKNHHVRGSFGHHVAWFDIEIANGDILRCSSDNHADLYHATFGGNGLTGTILTVALQLQAVESAWIVQKTLPAADLDAAIEIFETNHDATYSVAWIDCLASGKSRGRSLVLLGEHATPDELDRAQAQNPFAFPKRKAKRMPLDAPSWALNKYTIRAFNYLYYAAGKRAKTPEIVDYDSYFYPLDAILEWNRLYGSGGFAQYQCAFPLATSRDGLIEVLDAISASGMGSFLAVLKRFGPGAPERPLSFPMEGYTLALDFTLSPASLTLMNALDEILCRYGGRLYLAKDSRMSQATFEQGYAEGLPAFRQLRETYGATNVFQSLLSKRLNI